MKGLWIESTDRLWCKSGTESTGLISSMDPHDAFLRARALSGNEFAFRICLDDVVDAAEVGGRCPPRGAASLRMCAQVPRHLLHLLVHRTLRGAASLPMRGQAPLLLLDLLEGGRVLGELRRAAAGPASAPSPTTPTYRSPRAWRPRRPRAPPAGWAASRSRTTRRRRPSR